VFTALPATRRIAPDDRGDRHFLGALSSAGVRALVLSSLPTGVGIGIVEVAIPAFSRAHGAAPAAGVLLAVWSFGSGIGGLLYGALPRHGGAQRTHLIVAGLMPLTMLPLIAAPSIAVMALLVIPAGCCIAPLLATRYELVGGVAPPGMRTEAYTWPVTSFVGGIAGGAALAGGLVEGPGWRTAFAVAAAFTAAGAALAVAGRRALRPATSAA
jgi:MFS family permease